MCKYCILMLHVVSTGVTLMWHYANVDDPRCVGSGPGFGLDCRLYRLRNRSLYNLWLDRSLKFLEILVQSKVTHMHYWVRLPGVDWRTEVMLHCVL